jgi:two-component system sporulation sensor kinase B
MTSEYMTNLFINLFIILIVIQLIYFWHVKYGVMGVMNPLTVLSGQSIAILINMLFFPVEPSSEYELMNLSSISIILGTYYGGYAVGISLYILTVIISFVYATSFVWLHLFSGLITLLVALIFRKKYQNLKTRHRLVASCVTALISSLTVISIFLMIYDSDFNAIRSFLYVLLYTFGMFWLAYSIERLEKNRNFRNKLIDTEKMQSVSHLAASISHEVRNPLTATKGFLQLLRDDKNLSQEKKQQFIDIALSELDRAENIIKDYLAFAKPPVNSKEDIDIQTELNKVVDIIQPLANMRNVSVQLDLFPFKVKGERQLFQQCFVNIIKNGIESIGNGGGLLKITAVNKKKGIDIHITDTGIGMTTEQLKHLGEPYYSTKGVDGTGLGIMAVYRIIESMKGSIRVKSKPGEGTTFTIYLPGHE